MTASRFSRSTFVAAGRAATITARIDAAPRAEVDIALVLAKLGKGRLLYAGRV